MGVVDGIIYNDFDGMTALFWCYVFNSVCLALLIMGTSVYYIDTDYLILNNTFDGRFGVLICVVILLLSIASDIRRWRLSLC